MSDLMTQLTISVQGKRSSGKTAFAEDVIVKGVEFLGGSVVQKRDDKSGCFITVSLPQGAFTAKQSVPEKGPKETLLIGIGPDSHVEAFRLVTERAKVTRIINSADPVGEQLVQMPDYLDREALNTLVKTCALDEAKRIDTALAKMGFRYDGLS